MAKAEYYYQIKGKKGADDYSLSLWNFPPIFTGRVKASSKSDAKEKIEEEYGKKFPLRVLKKDLDSNEFLLKIEVIEGNRHIEAIFQERECEECKTVFRRVDHYNDANTRYKGTQYCSDLCNEIAKEKSRESFIDSNFYESLPVIYKITNKISGKCYIGQTIRSFTLRWWEHIKYGSDCKFHTAINEGKITDWIFEVIHICDNRDQLREIESHYIKKYNSIDDGYNSATV